MAGALVSLAPMILLFILAQQYFVRGIALTRPQGLTPVTGDEAGGSRSRPTGRASSSGCPVTAVARPRFPAIDAHNHLGPAFGGDWATRPSSELAAVMDDAGVEAIVDLDGGWGDGAAPAEIERWQAALPGRVAVFAGLDYDSLGGRSRRSARREARRLRDGVAAGATGPQGLEAAGAARARPARAAGRGRRSAPRPALGAGRRARRAGHDPRRGPDRVLRAARRSATSAGRSSRTHPDWHFWPTRPRGDAGRRRASRRSTS